MTTTTGPPAEAPVQTSVGDRLRCAREAAGLTREQVSARTRIRVPVLHDLEADRLGAAGSAVYTRGHIRAIAAAVGVDPRPLVEAFDERVGAHAPAALVVPEPVPAPRSASGSLSVPVSAPPERDQPRWLTASIAGAAVLVALLAFNTLSDDGPDRVQGEPVARTGTAPGASAAPDAGAPSPDATRNAAAGPTALPTAATLALRAEGRSWISVRNRGGYRLFEGTVEAGWTRTFADPERVTARVGNAAALRATCADVLGAAGGEGVALTLTCTPQGLARP